MMKSQTGLFLDTLSNEDIPELIALSASVGWDYDQNELSTIMSVGTVYGHKTERGDIVSSAAIIPYDSKLASIGMVIVHEKYRGFGLGKELTQACVHSVSTDVTIMLIATEEGKPLYRRLGFKTVTYVHKFLNENDAPIHPIQPIQEYDMLPLTDTHLSKILELDYVAFGSNRDYFLKTRIRQAKQGVVVKDKKEGSIVGYGLAVDGPIHTILGPIVAMNQDIAICIIHHFAKQFNGKLRIDVLDEQRSIITFLEQYGFKKVRKPPVMIKNSNELPKRNETLYSIAAQIFG